MERFVMLLFFGMLIGGLVLDYLMFDGKSFH